MYNVVTGKSEYKMCQKGCVGTREGMLKVGTQGKACESATMHRTPLQLHRCWSD